MGEGSKRLCCLALAVCALCCVCWAARAEAARWAVLVYICGSDLESEHGSASDDIREMLASGAGASEAVDVLIATGGASRWQRKDIPSGEVQYYRLGEDEPAPLQSAGRADMGDPDTLAAFLRYGMSAAPADHYALILWDHGGGPVYGVCGDENYDYDALTLAELKRALEEGLEGKRLDILAFDACLMNSIDSCEMAADYADYTLASQETVSQTGLDYDAWLSRLADEPDMEAAPLAEWMARTYVEDNTSIFGGGRATMSVVRSDAMPAVVSAANAFSAALRSLLASNYAGVMRLRGQMKSFGEYVGEDASDLLDVSLMCDAYSALLPDESAALKRAAAEAVICNETTRDIAGQAWGLSFFLPYATVRDEREAILSTYGEQDSEYAALVKALTSGAVSDGYTMAATTQTAESFYSYDVQNGSSGMLCSIWDGLYGDTCTAEDMVQSANGSIWDGLETVSGIWAGLSGNSPTAAPGGIWQGLQSPGPTAEPGGIWQGLQTVGPTAASGGIWQGLHTAAPAGAESPLGGIWAGLLNDDEDHYLPNEPNANVQAGISEASSPEAIVAAAQIYFSTSRTQAQYVYTMQLSREDLDHLESACGVLLRRDGDARVRLGNVGETTVDWSTGLVFSMFDGAWPTLEGEMVCAEYLYEQADGSVRFVIPARVNGLRMYLLAVNSADGQAQVLGATQGYDEYGFAIRGSIPLEAGMRVEPLHTVIGPDGGESQTVGAAITVPGEGLRLEWAPVQAGTYEYCFGLKDLSGGMQYTRGITLSF